MLLLIIILNWAFIKNLILKMIIAAGVFIIAEIKRKKKKATKLDVVAQVISALLLIMSIIVMFL